MVAHGEVWWFEEPDAKARPMVILTRDAAIPVLNTLLAAPLTRTIRGIASEVDLDPDDGMHVECTVSVGNTRQVAKGLLTRKITTLSPAKMHAICEALAYITDC